MGVGSGAPNADGVARFERADGIAGGWRMGSFRGELGSFLGQLGFDCAGSGFGFASGGEFRERGAEWEAD